MGDEAEARKWAEHAYDHAYNPLAWHLGEEPDAESQRRYRWLGAYDPARDYPGPDGILRRHTAATREAADVRDMKIGLNAGRSFASVFDGAPDPARPHGVGQNLKRLMSVVEKTKHYPIEQPANDDFQTDRPSNDNRVWREDAAPWGRTGFAKTREAKGATQAANLDGCREEWIDAYDICSKLSPNDPLRGGHRDDPGCAKGFVSERCWGNPIQWGVWKG